MSIALARAHPNLKKLVVQEYQHTVDEGSAQMPSDISGRVELVGHDFFEPQATAAADVYTLRHIFHDWSNESSAKIL